MVNPISFNTSITYNKFQENKPVEDSPNPLRLKANLSSLTAMSNYNQVLLKPKFDEDSNEILNKVDELINLSPKRLNLPHSFKINEINGERIFDSENKLKLIINYENGIKREYYPAKDNINIEKIIEKNKDTDEIISSIEPFYDKIGNLKTKLTIFDDKINKEYTMFTIEEDGQINSITKFSSTGNNFRTLFINPYSKAPERYTELIENKDGEFEIIDSNIGANKEIINIKKATPYKKTIIKYENGKKIIDVKQIN